MNAHLNAMGAEGTRLNAICPYFTMFPLAFPLDILRNFANPDLCVLDPFCGRGTTNFAARLCGMKTIGVDATPVAVAATRAKLIDPSTTEIVDAARTIVNSKEPGDEIPDGEFWRLAYREEVLEKICRIRRALLGNTVPEPVASALRGIMLGALHGPLGKRKKSYFSNQSPRTYGPKPTYAIKFWATRNLSPPRVDVLGIVADRAMRYYGKIPPRTHGTAIIGDSRESSIVREACERIGGVDWVITSPPYYGMRTYLPDQWIRNWFLGGPPAVDYTSEGQLSHNGRDSFVSDLRDVWTNVGEQCRPGARMAVRFGAIRDRSVDDPARLFLTSIDNTGWVATGNRHADNAARGKRQADTFIRNGSKPCNEVDIYAQWKP